ncbi:DUF1553 domain-containing protein [Rudanella lutea]|uniref:DUF1553 domain-containing protein n=1 Tax=Rudanella lutea TaxID=451374 RepID=UPI00037E7CE4|nr:DUF1553 domain-containing protein [Rudanella lutea]
MKPKHLLIGGLGTVVLLSSFSMLGVFEQKVDYNTQIKPILNKQCIACHGGVKKTAGFSLLFRHEALAPTKSGKPAIVPGDADASEMIRRLTLDDPKERMPLDGPPLSEEEIQLLRDWVDQGAEWGDHWAYTPVEKPEVPRLGSFWNRLGISIPGMAESDETTWAKNEIDHFVLDGLRTVRDTTTDAELAKTLRPSAEASRATLLRRVSLDLTGLPPTPEQVSAFVRDTSPDAYEKQVDRLLASSAYGEKWAGMWLDLARYADTKGYERDPGRQIWRYRDWLIKAFNDDKPYNLFLTEQLAGDLMPNRDPVTGLPPDDQLVATGFHRNTMNNDEGGTQDEEFRVAAVIDRVNTTWDVFGGTTFACVQCHSHPYDPFTHEEYYKYMAFFNNTRDEDVTTDTPTLRFYKDKDSVRVQELYSWMGRLAPPGQTAQQRQFLRTLEPKFNSHALDQYQKASLLDAKFFGILHEGSGRLPNVTLTGQNRLLLAWSNETPGATLTIRRDSLNGPVLVSLPVPAPARDTVQIFPIPEVAGRHNLFFRLDNPKGGNKWVSIKWIAFQRAMPGQPADRLGAIETEYALLLNKRPQSTPILLDGTGDLARATQVFDRGNWLVKTKRVQPDVPKSILPLAPGLPRNRLGLARWMTDRKHPLTARVAVNRFWEQLFGTGLVETVEDLGTQGSTPTHRALLDYLAAEFMETDGWRVKKMLRRMVLSATYRQQSAASAALVAADPTNKYLARGPRVRLAAEQVRDQALAVSGLLNPKMYGPSVMPPQPDGIWQSPYNGESWKLSDATDRNRRALYTYWKRTAPYPSMITFDSPSREFCQVRRLRTNTPLQALVTLNDPVYVEAAQTLADCVREQARTPEEQIKAAFRRVALREIEPRKLAVLLRLYRNTEQHYRQHPDEAQQLMGFERASPALAALTVTTNTVLNLDEVITKE